MDHDPEGGSHHDPRTAPGLAPDPISPEAFCVDGATLCRLRFWTEAEWAALPPGGRPPRATHRPGVGWVAAVPVETLN